MIVVISDVPDFLLLFTSADVMDFMVRKSDFPEVFTFVWKDLKFKKNIYNEIEA